MDYHVQEHYKESSGEDPVKGTFHRVIALHESPNIHWEEVLSYIPNMSRGWYELCHLSTKDRLDFTRDFWFSKLPYHQNIENFLENFFSQIDDIGVYITQRTFDGPYQCQFVYSVQNNGGYYHGELPADDKALISLSKAFPQVIFPQDFISFMQIHNGFSKGDDVGIVRVEKLQVLYKQLQELFINREPLFTSKGQIIDPSRLIPFYSSFGTPNYQCFWEEWYPEQEMGNVYYSEVSKTISDINAEDDTMAFPSFSAWLQFYLEMIIEE
ncbi:hypothetical protein N9Y92_02695 [Chlamydiales bacterium]|nr:hypothetical protein [Chlamydiales bacterium]